jgi:hypothetical protein
MMDGPCTLGFVRKLPETVEIGTRMSLVALDPGREGMPASAARTPCLSAPRTAKRPCD